MAKPAGGKAQGRIPPPLAGCVCTPAAFGGCTKQGPSAAGVQAAPLSEGAFGSPLQPLPVRFDEVTAAPFAPLLFKER